MNTPQVQSSLKTDENWLRDIISQRMELINGTQSGQSNYDAPSAPALNTNDYYADFIQSRGLEDCERLALVLCFFAAYKQSIFQPVLQAARRNEGFMPPEIGGVFDKVSGRFCPTLQTAIFLFAGDNDELAAHCYSVLNHHNPLFADGILRLSETSPGNSFFPSFIVSLDFAYFSHFLHGKKIRLDEMENFPAQLLETTKTFDDLVLAADAKNQLKSVMNYARNYRSMHQKTGGQLQGYVAMLFGPPGTGKTMTASVIGKELGMDVYMVNLSRVISKYIGETEKNLEIVFDRLGNRECILFFDEADALFGKRSEVTEANDRYANQEIAYLLQKIDNCNCLVMLATNFRQNLDFAFTRRILSYIKIDWPGNQERRLLWEKSLVPPFSYAPENLPELMAQKYAITGANIANVVKLACYEALAKDTSEITAPILESFIRLEYIKEKRNPNDPGNWPINQMN